MNKLFYFLLLLLSFNANAQYNIFFTGQDSVGLNQEVEIGVNVSDALAVSAITARVVWDTTYLEYVNLGSINTNIPFMNEDALGLTPAENGQGRINMLWQDMSGTTKDFTDPTQFFSIIFKGKQLGFTNLEFVNVEMTDLLGNTYNYNITNANMLIVETVDVDDLERYSDIKLGNFMPNPTTSDATINLTSSTSKELSMVIQNNLGQNIYNQKIQLNQGLNTIFIGEDKIKDAGIYFISFSDGQHFATRKLIVK